MYSYFQQHIYLLLLYFLHLNFITWLYNSKNRQFYIISKMNETQPTIKAGCVLHFIKLFHDKCLSSCNLYGINFTFCHISIDAFFLSRSPFEEVFCYLFKYCVREHVFFFFIIAQRYEFRFNFFVFRFQ